MASMFMMAFNSQPDYSSLVPSADIFGPGADELTGGSHQDLPTKNKDDISKVHKLITKQIIPELEKNGIYDRENNEINSANIDAVKNYLEKKIEDSVFNIEKSLSMMYANLNKNIEAIVNINEDNHLSLESKAFKNSEMIARKLSEEKSSTIDGLERRLKQHEDLQTTHLAICGEQFSHLGKGRVDFNIFMESVSIKGEKLRGTNVLLPDGRFQVPQGGDGIYEVSLSLILDTVHDRANKTASAKFVFESIQSGRHQVHQETQLVSNVGRPDKDKVPASRSTLWDLKGGDQVMVKQLNSRAERTYRITLIMDIYNNKDLAPD